MAPAVGGGVGSTGFGSFVNEGHFTVQSSPIRIPSGTTVINSGTMVLSGGADLSLADGATLSHLGVLENTDGSVSNLGTITLRAAVYSGLTGSIAVPGPVSGHNYLVTFDLNERAGSDNGAAGSVRGASSPVPHRVFAATFAEALEPIPTPGAITGFEFSGWSLAQDGTGDAFTALSDLTALSQGIPATVKTYAKWIAQKPDSDAEADVAADGQGDVSGDTSNGASADTASESLGDAHGTASSSGGAGPSLARTGSDTGSLVALGQHYFWGQR